MTVDPKCDGQSSVHRGATVEGGQVLERVFELEACLGTTSTRPAPPHRSAQLQPDHAPMLTV